MGPLQGIIGMLPGIPKELKNAEIDDGEIGRVEAIIRSMTPEERRNPEIINGSPAPADRQRQRHTTAEVNQLLKQFKEMQKMMKWLRQGGTKRLRGAKARRCRRCPTGSRDRNAR